MGRLFWKFFFAIFLAHMASVVLVAVLIELHHRNHPWPDPVSADFVREGPPRPGFDGGPRPPPFGDGAGVREAPPIAKPGQPPQNLRRFGPPRGPFFVPTEVLLAGLLTSMLFAWLLAWYFSKPIRSLRRALEAAARGQLDVRLGSEMGKRRDELADLGRHFDSMAQQLQQLVDGQRRLFHDVSHELRSPLARMQAAIGLARQTPARADEAMMRVERESVRVDAMVRELLTLARLESGMAARGDEEVSLGELIAIIVEDSQVEAEARQCQLQFHEKVDASLIGQAELLRRAIENVVRNAIKHSPEGGLVDVSLNRVDATHVAVRVGDQGSGVPEADLAGIFKPFFRGAQARTADGHGLGLAIAQGVVEMHGGHIHARNRAPHGLLVTMEFPVSSSEDLTDAPRARQ